MNAALRTTGALTLTRRRRRRRWGWGGGLDSVLIAAAVLGSLAVTLWITL